jgi:hypothetical protein
MEQTFPELKGDLQGSLNKEISKSEILDIMCATGSSDKEKVE